MGDPGWVRTHWERIVSLAQAGRMIFMGRARRAEARAAIRGKVFSRIAHEGRWGEKFSSGYGSSVDYTANARLAIRRIIEWFGITSMVDVACGDFGWMPLALAEAPDGFRYVGGDIVPELVERARSAHPEYEFRVIDFVSDELPRCDLIFCRDVLQHLPLPDIQKALRNFSRSGAKYLLATTYLRCTGRRNARRKRVGQCCDRNLIVPPFNLADPIVIFGERDPAHKFLGLWELPLHDSNGKTLE